MLMRLHCDFPKDHSVRKYNDDEWKEEHGGDRKNVVHDFLQIRLEKSYWDTLLKCGVVRMGFYLENEHLENKKTSKMINLSIVY